MAKTLRIGNASGFWGDRVDAAKRLVQAAPDIDYLTLDYLAEVSLSIMAIQRDRNPEAGYARDFIGVVRDLAPFWRDGVKTRIVTNAGGLNPRACAEACADVLRKAGVKGFKIGVVLGDDVLPQLRDTYGEETKIFTNLDNGLPISAVADRLVTANAYLGATGAVDALAQGANIVLTGRLADPSMTVAPCIHEFGWSPNAYDRIAGATIAGHLLECGSQANGGISTHWLEFPHLADMAFPIAEVSEDGSCVMTIPEGHGGAVTEWTVKEQLLYELGDPARYLSPDATVNFLTLAVEEIGKNRVRVSGATGGQPPPTLKVSATYRDGYRASGELTIFGRDAVAKARKCGEVVLERLRQAGYEYDRTLVECLGANAAVPGVLPERALTETVLRIGVADKRKEAVERFSVELMPLVCGGPQGTTGYAAGRPNVSPVFGYWPCLIESERVPASVEVLPV